MGPIQQVPWILSFCQNVKLRTIGYVRTIQSVYCIGMKDVGKRARMDGAGWMEGLIHGVRSLLQVVRDMMEYDGI